MTTLTSPQSTPQAVKSIARKIAVALKDNANYRLYLAYCQKYPLEVIWRAFAEVQQVPYERIRKSKGALFNYLVQKYAKEKDHELDTHRSSAETA
jgi:hypothetical protein